MKVIASSAQASRSARRCRYLVAQELAERVQRVRVVVLIVDAVAEVQRALVVDLHEHDGPVGPAQRRELLADRAEPARGLLEERVAGVARHREGQRDHRQHHRVTARRARLALGVPHDALGQAEARELRVDVRPGAQDAAEPQLVRRSAGSPRRRGASPSRRSRTRRARSRARPTGRRCRRGAAPCRASPRGPRATRRAGDASSASRRPRAGAPRRRRGRARGGAARRAPRPGRGRAPRRGRRARRSAAARRGADEGRGGAA